MPKCKFSEDEYECLLISEIYNPKSYYRGYFKPTRVFEHIVGYDFAVYTNYFGEKVGIHTDDTELKDLISSSLKHLRHPHRFVSTFIQCKVPFTLQRKPPHKSSSKSIHLKIWESWNGTMKKTKENSYPESKIFEFRINKHQNKLLIDLEYAVRDLAWVLYGSPCFFTYEDMDIFSFTGSVTKKSHFVIPSVLSGHNHYSYTKPEAAGTGHSDPENIDNNFHLHNLFGIENKIDKLVEEPLSHYLDRLWESLSSLEFTRNYVEPSDDYFELEARKILSDYSFMLKDLEGDELYIEWFNEVESTLSKYLRIQKKIDNLSSEIQPDKKPRLKWVLFKDRCYDWYDCIF